MYYGGNDWRDYLAHSWGTSPEMKQKEREYNAKYYQEHKEEILTRRGKDRYGGFREHVDYDSENAGFEGGRYTDKKKKYDLSDANRSEFDKAMAGYKINDEMEAQNEWTQRSSWFKNLPPNVQANVKAHNDQVTQNIQALQGHVDQYLQSHPDLPEAQRNQLLKNLKSQMKKAEDEYITPDSSEDRAYVSDLMKKAKKG